MTGVRNGVAPHSTHHEDGQARVCMRRVWVSLSGPHWPYDVTVLSSQYCVFDSPTHCHTLQHTASHCNILPHTTTQGRTGLIMYQSCRDSTVPPLHVCVLVCMRVTRRKGTPRTTHPHLTQHNTTKQNTTHTRGVRVLCLQPQESVMKELKKL